MRSFPIPERLRGRAHLTADQYTDRYAQSLENPQQFWAEAARERLLWERPFKQVLEWDYTKGHIRWFEGGSLNVCVNCVDRHLDSRGDKIAIIWEGNDPAEMRRLTYRQLYREVCRTASMLRALGVKKGDRVTLYLPMVPELAISMLACARIGAIHSVVFAGFSAESLRDRINDCGSAVLITANEGVRGSKTIPLKDIVDKALEGAECVQHVVVLKRTNAAVAMQAGRDHWWEELHEKAAEDPRYELMEAEDPLYILYTSGSTGKPKGLLHTSAGYLLYTSFTHRLVFDYHEEDVHFCAADVGWVTGHSYIVYGPLANGATTVLFESTPVHPDPGRYWAAVERHRATIFYTAPTAIRTLAKEGDSWVRKYDRSSLRVLGSVGEPINYDAWMWYYEVVGEGRCAVVDTWWQTETGGILISPLPGATPTKPGSATKPLLGIKPVIVDEEGKELKGNGVSGRLCISFPWPGQARTIWGDHDRFVETYFRHYPGLYFTGDAASRDEDGYYWLAGRVDDVLLVSGHRIGTAEIESAIVRSGIVAEAAVVGAPHPIKGVGVYAFCILKEGIGDNSTTRRQIVDMVREVIGGIAVPDVVQCVPGLPKTRSGKIMRRILRKIAEGEREHFGDVTTLAEPAVVEQIARGATLIR